MSGVKRDRDGNARKMTLNIPRARFQDMFEGFRDELDEHHDRRERIIKVSRDVTAQSKKIIFALQRVKQLNQELPPSTQQDMDARLAEVHRLLSSIAPDLTSVNRHRYQYQLRCLEELVEALSFAHYLRHQGIVTPEQAQASLPEGVALTAGDYLYGLFDLFGEMMRFATVTTAQAGQLPGDEGRTILGDMQQLGCAFEMLRAVPTKEYRGKMEVMRQSVNKVERIGYGLVVRGSERPRGWVPDFKDERPASPEP